MTGRHLLFGPVVFVGGLLFGLGLAVSGMVRPEVVLGFLRIEDLGLLLVMGGAAAVVATGLRLVPRLLGRAPLTSVSYGRRTRPLDRDVLLGGAVFGAGWGLSGICPGAAYASVGVGNWPVLWAIAGMFVGAYGQGVWRTTRGTAATVTPSPD